MCSSMFYDLFFIICINYNILIIKCFKIKLNFKYKNFFFF